MIIMTKKHKNGFTLVELLIVIGVIAVLASLAFVGLDLLARFQDSRNAQRWTDVNAILSAIKLHQVDNQGIYDSSISSLTDELYYQIGEDDEGNCADTCVSPGITMEAACVDLDSFISGDYLQEIPIDPSDTNASYNETRYYLIKHTSGAITVAACSEEQGSATAVPTISVTR